MGRIDVHVEYADRWSRHGSTFVRGRAFRDGRCHRAPELASLVDRCSPEEFERLLTQLNGFFAVVHADGDSGYAAVDHVRSIPLFYARENGSVYLSDHAQWIKGQLEQARYDRLAESELAIAGIVSGRDTLYRDIRQLQAGELLFVDAEDAPVDWHRTRAYRYRPHSSRDASDEALRSTLDDVLESAFDRLVAVADGRQIAVSLSGGYDSRLVACCLARSAHDDVTTFSFGLAGNPEAEAGRQVAAALDLPWEFVEYSPDLWPDWFGSREQETYYRRAFNYDSLPSIGAVPALGELRRSGRLSRDAVIVSGDAITSTQEHIPRACLRGEPMDRSAFVDEVTALQYRLWEADEPQPLRERIGDRWEGGVLGGHEAAAVVEAWDWAERQSKFIVSGDEYSHWGFDWWLPLFDRECAAFWQRVPLRHRFDKRLHRARADEMYEALTGSSRDDIPAAERSGFAAWVKGTVARSPVGNIAQTVYDRVAPSGGRPDHLGFSTAVPDDRLDSGDARGRSIHAYKVLDLLGWTSFDSSGPVVGPRDGVVTVETGWLQTEPDRVGTRPWFEP